MSDPLHSVSVAGVVVNEIGHVLLIQRRDNNQWQAPGGVLEKGETFEAGVIREVREETNVDVQVDRLTGVYKNMAQSVVALVYRCHPVGGSPTPTAEASDAAWFALSEAINRMTPAFAARVRDAVSGGPAASRAHDGHDLLP
jgi:8-oxo-dGTP diphosphatase